MGDDEERHQGHWPRSRLDGLPSHLCFYAVLASSMTVYIGPGAMGSGIAELMGYLNGI